MGFRRRHETHEIGAVGQGQAAVEPRRELRPCPWGVGSVCDQAGKCGRRAGGSAQGEAIGSVMKTTVAALFGILLAAPAWAQIQPSGTFTPGHALRVLNSQGTAVGDAGGSAGSSTSGSGYLTELGITNTGTPLCINDALTNATSGYHQLCLGANALGGALISYNAYGGATPLGVTFNINGTDIPFPGPGSGTVVGPGTTVVGNLVTWNSNNGTIIADAGFGQAVTPLPVPPNTITGTVPGLDTTTGIGFRKATATSTDGNNVLIVRDAEFSGGQSGFVNTALQVATYAKAGITSYEWAGLFYLYNDGVLADAAQQTGLYSRVIKAATGSTWAATFECDDANTALATGPCVALELDVYANGSDTSSNRTGLHIVANKLIGAGTVPVVQWAIKLGAGPSFGTFVEGIDFITDFVVGIDMRLGTFSSAGMWLPDGVPIVWDTAGTSKTFFNSGNDCTVFATTGNAARQEMCTSGGMDATDGTVKISLLPTSGSSVGIVGTTTNHDLALYANNAEQARLLAAGGLELLNLPTVAAGTGKHFLCYDSTSHIVYDGTGASCN